MHFPMSIDILEIHKCKNSFHAHFIVKSIHSFLYDAKLPKILLRKKIFFFFKEFVIFLLKMLKGGSDKGEILVMFKLGYLQKKSPK